jgi:protoporphyrinogen oxidase
METSSTHTSVVIIGAGPAGLTAGYCLLQQDAATNVTVIEADPVYVGGIARTAEYKGFRFDIGGHRFFSKSKRVEDFWTELLPDDMLQRPRSSRIFYRGKLFSYPLKASEALFKLGIFESALCMLSYLKAQVFPIRDARSFQDWITNKFGYRLFSIFFKTYTEKVWGMSCKEISADWAAQRIKGLSLGSAIKNALLPTRQPKDRSQVIKSLVDTFRYPRLGPGMMWEVCAKKIRAMGGEVLMGHKMVHCDWNQERGLWTVTCVTADGAEMKIEAHHLISSAPLKELGRAISPQLSEKAMTAAASLKYRDFLTVVLILKDRDVFTDNWIYIHDPSVMVGRIQNFKSWSPEMVPDPAMCCYGLEYFCFAGDGLWTTADVDLVEMAKAELEKLGLAKAVDVIDGCVVRQPKAYPVYDDEYATHVEVMRAEIEARFPTLHMVGRNGMHKYNNQDHAMMTAMLTAENILAGARIHDVWEVNQDAEYHEEGSAGAQSSVSGNRMVPSRLTES